MTKRTNDGGRATVIATARMFFAQKGFHQTAMSELSEKAGISVGQIYRLFSNKGDMIAAIVEEDISKRVARLTHICGEAMSGRLSAREAIHQVVLDALTGNEEALTFEILAEASRNRDVGNLIGELCDQYRANLGAVILQARPELTGLRLAAATEMFMATLFGLDNRQVTRPSLSVEDIASMSTDMVLAMLAY